MATKGSGKAIQENSTALMQSQVMSTQSGFIDDWDSIEVLGIGPENDEDEDEEDEDDDGSDIEELDEDDLDEDDSDEDDSEEEDEEDDD